MRAPVDLKLRPVRADAAGVDWLYRARLALNIDNDALAAHRPGIRLRFS
jgi:hypothetical protein